MTLTVQLSGHNFVSEKTKAAFEKALQDGHCVETVAGRARAGSRPLNAAGSQRCWSRKHRAGSSLSCSQVRDALVNKAPSQLPSCFGKFGMRSGAVL